MGDVRELDSGVSLLAAYHTPPGPLWHQRQIPWRVVGSCRLKADSSAIKPPRNDKIYKTYTCDRAGVSVALAAAGDSFARFLICGPAALGFAFIPELLAFGQGQFNFYFTVLEVQAGGDQG